MTDLEILDQRIKDLKRLLKRTDLTQEERIMHRDTLNFLLDTRALRKG